VNLEPDQSEPSPEELDRACMARLITGHDAALNELMERHGERLFHFLVRHLQNETDAADLAQEAFVRVYQNRSKYDRRQKFSTWLFAIAANLARDRLRWRSRHPAISIDAENPATGEDFRESIRDTAASPSEELQKKEMEERVRAGIAELPEDLRVALILAEYENLSAAEIAGVLRCKEKAVENRLYRARKQLREALQARLGKFVLYST
jgi:RNA polymerase sigma factor (sigma-70 family)